MPKIDSFGNGRLEAILRLVGGIREVMLFAIVCAALFGALCAVAATYGAGKSTYLSVIGALTDPPHDDSMTQTIANFCDARINWMAVNGPVDPMSRALIYGQLDQACPDNRDAIDRLRRTKPV